MQLRTIADYFLAIAPIWQAHAGGLISASQRDARLAPWRAQLAELPPSWRREDLDA